MKRIYHVNLVVKIKQKTILKALWLTTENHLSTCGKKIKFNLSLPTEAKLKQLILIQQLWKFKMVLIFRP